ncbi:hypothetical protein [Methanoculleus chikugoensis]|uniref:hypothetical protein n=1 Tax=Methanoculleus chikugoensis TaxID=118126 RepID=UPI001FB425FE|nr:hypothetical protein [Methanoculleus chikugoensis]
MKIIKDPVHGYVEADALVLRLLDSEVVQRLRHVTQLGFANLVYPPGQTIPGSSTRSGRCTLRVSCRASSVSTGMRRNSSPRPPSSTTSATAPPSPTSPSR